MDHTKTSAPQSESSSWEQMHLKLFKYDHILISEYWQKAGCKHLKLDLPTSRAQISSRAGSASGRFFMFSAAKKNI